MDQSQLAASRARSPEANLIIGAAGVRGGPPAGHDLDWVRVQRVARDQGVLALLARHLKTTGWKGVPAPVVASLTAYRAGLTARNVLLTRQLLTIIEVLDQAGIPSLPYKGPLLAAYAYGDLGLRPFADLDLIVAEGDVLRAKDHLEAEGYVSLAPHMDRNRPGRVPPGYALALRRTHEQIVVELHWRLTPTFPLTMEHLATATVPFPLLGTSVPCLSPERTLLVLCVHGAKHAWERLEWICGVAHVIHRQPSLDWDGLAADARAVGARRSVALGLALAATVGRAAVPAEVLRDLGGRRVVSVARQIDAGLCVDARPARRSARRYSLRFQVSSASDRLGFLLFLRLPTERDRSFLALPPALSFLYVLVRPLRVAYDHRPQWWQARAERRRVRRAGGAQAVQGGDDERAGRRR